MEATQALEWDPTLEDDAYTDDEEVVGRGIDEKLPRAEGMGVASAPRNMNLLTREEEISLAKLVERGDQEARQRLIDANHRLVFSVVNKYRYSGVPLEDLVQEGFLGLIAAADKFDYKRGCRFSTVATIWIRAHVLQAIQNLRPLVHVPQRVANAAKRMWRATEELTQELERRPTAEELATKLSLEASRVDELSRISQDWLSLDEPLGDDGDTSMMEMVADDQQSAPALAAQRTCLREQLSVAMGRLTEREQIVLRLRFGLDDGQERTLDEIGRQFDLTRQRIKEIETAALGKLRNGGPARQRLEPAWAGA